LNYVIIFLVVALLVSPIFWIMPNPRQKRLVQLRQKAMAAGFQVKVCDLPQTHRAKVRQEPVRKGVMYRLPWKVQIKAAQNFHYLVVREQLVSDMATDSQQYTAIEQQINQALLSMPAQILALECTAAGVGLYWREQGEIDPVVVLFDAARQLQATLHPMLINTLRLQSR